MKMQLCVLGAIGAASLASACSVSVPPTSRAAAVEHRQCAGSEGSQQQDDIRLLQATTVLGAEPLYSHMHTNTNDEERVSGAKLIIRPPQGVSADRLAALLQCHSARLLLGQVDRSQLPDDPYWLPQAWVDIDVTPQAGNFVVTLSADSVSKNLQVLQRATAFADAHRPAAAP